MSQKNDDKLVTVAGLVSPTVREAVETYRWQHRLSVSDVVREAIAEFLERHTDAFEGADVIEFVDSSAE